MWYLDRRVEVVASGSPLAAVDEVCKAEGAWTEQGAWMEQGAWPEQAACRSQIVELGKEDWQIPDLIKINNELDT